MGPFSTFLSQKPIDTSIHESQFWSFVYFSKLGVIGSWYEGMGENRIPQNNLEGKD